MISSSSTTRIVPLRVVGMVAVMDGLRCRAPLRSAGRTETGNVSVNLVPCPTELSQRIVPSCSLTIPYEMDSPRPVPRPMALVVKKGS